VAASLMQKNQEQLLYMAVELQFQGEKDDAATSKLSISLLGPMQNTSARNLSQSLTWFQVCWATP
jgi:hypothetical protein